MDQWPSLYTQSGQVNTEFCVSAGPMVPRANSKTPITIEFQEKTGSARIDFRWDGG